MNITKENIKELKKLIGRKHKVYTKIDHVSQSGMTRHISCYVVHKGELHNVTYLVGAITDYRPSKKTYGLVVSGCGMDMGFHLIYTLSRIMYPKGFKSSLRNGVNGMNPKAKGYEWDNDGGYRINHEWM